MDPSVRVRPVAVCAEAVGVVDSWPGPEGDAALPLSVVEVAPEETIGLDNLRLAMKAEGNSTEVVALWLMLIIMVENPLGLEALE